MPPGPWDIAVVGWAARLPGPADSITAPDGLWPLLTSAKDAIKPVAAHRRADDLADGLGPLDPTWSAALLDRVDLFDPAYFGLTRTEAARIDPAHRLFMDLAAEAMDRAGQAGQRLEGVRTGVFAGLSDDHYYRLSRIDSAQPPSGLDQAEAMAAHRVSHSLGLTGPSLSLDAVCASGLLAIHQACLNLITGQCDLALAGGVQIISSADHFRRLARLGLLSPTGRSRPLSASADGLVPGEGGTVFLLKPLDQALADRDPIEAVIKGGAANHAGRSDNIALPNGPAVTEVINLAWQAAGLNPAEAEFFETSAGGTPLADAIEVRAINTARGPAPGIARLGVVKSRLGNLEAASGPAGLIKILAALERNQLPPDLLDPKPNPLLKLESSGLALVTEPIAWPTGPAPRLAGLTALGVGGANVHLVIEEPPPAEQNRPTDQPLLLCLSAKSEPALDQLRAAYAERLVDAATSFADPAGLCLGHNTGREHFTHRLAAVGRTKEELIAALTDPTSGNAFTGRRPDRSKKNHFLARLQAGLQADLPAAPDRLQPDQAPADPWERALYLAKEYAAGREIDFIAYYQDRPANRVELPVYPHQRQSCWARPEAARSSDPDRPTSAHSTIDLPADPTAALVFLAGQWLDAPVDPTDRAADLGLDSLALTEMIVRIEQTSGRKFSPIDLPTNPSLAELGQAFAEERLSPRPGRISLRPASVRDWPIVQAWLADPALTRWLDPFFHHDFRAREYAFFLKRSTARTYLVLDQDRPVGLTGLTDWDRPNRTAEAWLALADPLDRTLIPALAAGAELHRIAFRDLDINSLTAKVRADNRPALGLMKLTGWRLVGRLEDSLLIDGAFHDRLLFQLTKDKWRL